MLQLLAVNFLISIPDLIKHSSFRIRYHKRHGNLFCCYILYNISLNIPHIKNRFQQNL
jgi:hypothetical protein